MTRTRTKRLGRVRDAVDASPVRREVLKEAYEWFTLFGELTDDDHVAFEVVERALRGGQDAPVENEAVVVKRADRARVAYHQREHPHQTWPPSVRGMIFDEALFEAEPMRKLARAAITLEVIHGGDVENPAFMARFGIPAYGCVAMHVMRWQDRLSMAPYEDDATRLFVRLDNVRGRIDQDDPNWSTVQAKAIVAFHRHGELPDDELLLEAVLVDVGLDLLQAHKRGKDVAEGIALIGKLERAKGEEFEGLLEQLGALVSAKQLIRPRPDAANDGPDITLSS